MADITLNKNMYFSGLVNFILFVRLYATNTSKKQTSIVNVFASETLEYGDTKAYQFAELPKVEDYSLTSSLLTNKPIKYSEEFIGKPIKKKISLSRCEPFLKMAVINSSGMSTFVAYILGLMESAKEDFLYDEILKDLLNWTPTVSAGKKMKQEINLLNVSALSTPSEIISAEEINQKRIELLIQKSLDEFQIFGDAFIDVDNEADTTNFKTAVKREDLIFIGNAKYMNERVVNLMATLLKSELIDENFKRPTSIKIPEVTMEKYSQSDCIGFIVHKHWYQWFYHFNFMGNFFDPDTLLIKNVLHFWFSKGRLKGLPAMQLTAKFVGANPGT